MRALGLSSEAKPKNLTADQWIFVQNMTIAYTQFKSSSELSGDGVHSDELDVAMAWWARKIGCGQSDCKQSECGSLWKCVVVDVMRDLGEAIGTPWKWPMHCDSRMKISLLDIQAFHDISVALSRQWFEGKLNIKIPRSLLGNWLVPHKGQMQAVGRESNLVVHRLLHPVYVAPLLGPDDVKTPQVRDIDYAAINDVQNALEIEIHDSGLDGYGTAPEDAVEMKITGDGGNCSRRQSIVFNALQNVDRRRRIPITGYTNSALQSTDDLIPVVAIVGKETGALWHSYFKPSFAFKKMVEANNGWFYHRGLNRKYYIKVRGCTDQSTMHKISGTCERNDKGIKVVKSRGGAISTCGCHMCDVNGKFAHQPKTGNKRCGRCQSYDGTKDQIDYCYCHEILVKGVIARIERDVKKKLESLPNKCVPAFIFLQVLGIDSLNSGQLLELDIPDDTSRRDTSRQLKYMLKNDFISALDKDKKLPQHINKPPGTTTAAVSKRTQNIRKCLAIFGVESTGVYRVIKTRLKNLLDTCYYIVEKQQQLKKASVDPSQLIQFTEDMIPCLLHMKKNTQEALVTPYLNDIYNTQLRPDLKTQEQRKAAVAEVDNLINKHGLRKMEGSFQHESSLLEKGAGVGRISLDIYVGERMIRRAGKRIIDLCMPTSLGSEQTERNARMKRHLDTYIELMDELNKPYLENGDLIFKLSNKYFHEGVQMWDTNFVINYSHIIGSMHALWFMENGLYLKVYEQQSVEGFVKLMRSIWYNKTSRGGREQVKGGKRGESRQAPRMRRVFEILLRRFFWHRGRLTKHFDPTFTRSCDQAIFSSINYDDDDDDGDYCEAPIYPRRGRLGGRD